MSLTLSLETQIRQWTEELVLEIKNEIEQQGHRATGKLIDSTEAEYESDGSTFVARIMMQSYGHFVNTGFKPKFSIPGRASTSNYIQALIDWLDVKQIGSLKERKGIAFAIAKVASKTGHPTPGSYRYSMNGRRKGWAEHTIDKKVMTLPDSLNLENFVVEIFGKAFNPN